MLRLDAVTLRSADERRYIARSAILQDDLKAMKNISKQMSEGEDCLVKGLPGPLSVAGKCEIN